MWEPRRLTKLWASTADADAAQSVKGRIELDGRGSIHGRGRELVLECYLQTESEALATSSIYSPVMGFWAKSGRIMKLTAHLQLMPRLRMHLLRCGVYAQAQLVTSTAAVGSKFWRDKSLSSALTYSTIDILYGTVLLGHGIVNSCPYSISIYSLL
jgi:hypothetical protein